MKTTDCARAAEMLLEARATRRWLDALPDGAQPASETEAYTIQDMVARRLGPIVGWKVGSATLDSEPFRAPIHEATLRIEDPRLPAGLFHVIGVEAEIVYRFARDLPPRATPYARDEVLAAVGSMHPAVEMVDTRFSAFGSVDALSQRADQQNHGALSVGPALQNWSLVDPVRQPGSGKTALVTEANTGLGQAIAVALAKAGAALVGVGRSTMDETAHRCAEMGAAFQSIEADLATTEPIARILEAETRLTGRIDILINNDGIIRRPDVSMSPRPIGMR